MIDWLEEDLNPSADNGDDNIAQEDQTMTVEVVDAATLLSSQYQSSSNLTNNAIETMSVENITLKTNRLTGNGVDIQEVEVVDAAALLASMEKDGPVEVETEVIMAPTSVLDGSERAREEAVSASGVELTESHDEVELTSTAIDSKTNPIFSPHDLVSMAWSVTELRDTLRTRVVGMVVELVARLGSTSTKGLTGGDLANLAWAVSKYEDELSEKDKNRPSPLSLSVVRLVAHSAHQRVVESHEDGAEGVEFDALQIFQPPELGRLLWAIAYTMSTCWQVPDEMRNDSSIHELARFALETAASHLSLFATEDLVS
jgi:hypothetical protein